MNRRGKALLAAVAAAFCLINIQCSGKKSLEPGRFYSTEKKFSIIFPEGWEVRTEDWADGCHIEAVSPWEDDEDLFSEYIGVDVQPVEGGSSLSEVFAGMLDEQAKEFEYFKEIERGDIRLNGNDARYLIFDIGMEEGQNRVISYTLVKKGKSFLIGCVAEDVKFEDYRERFEESAGTFRFE
ncbi:MAG: hypothetical protein JW746_06780 [Candidatus Krumholzibacteriota bacterium]|nr:hypothetical protein [Candidatus Krumholzibacteriota bacterium]